jgi:hypothetical protein
MYIHDELAGKPAFANEKPVAVGKQNETVVLDSVLELLAVMTLYPLPLVHPRILSNKYHPSTPSVRFTSNH